MDSGPNSSDDGLRRCGDFVEGFIPGDAGEAAFAFRAGAAQGIEQAVGGVFAFEIAGYFAAEETAGYGMGGVAAQLEPRPVLSTSIRREQASGQSSAQTEWRVSVTVL